MGKLSRSMVMAGRFCGVPGAGGSGENGSSSSSEPEPFAARLVVNGNSGLVPAVAVRRCQLATIPPLDAVIRGV
jgi:hypothetical protein